MMGLPRKRLANEGQKFTASGKVFSLSARQGPACRQPPCGSNSGFEATLALATHDLLALNTLRCITRVDHQLRLLHDPAIVVLGMIGHDKHAIVLSEILQRRALHLQIILAALSNGGKKWIVIADLGPFLLQQLD